MKNYTGFKLKKHSLPFESYSIIDDNDVVGSLTYDDSILTSTFKDKIVYREEVSFNCEEERDRYYSLATWEIKKEIIRQKITRFSNSNNNIKSIPRHELYHLLYNLCEDLEIEDHLSSSFRKTITDWLEDNNYEIIFS